MPQFKVHQIPTILRDTPLAPCPLPLSPFRPVAAKLAQKQLLPLINIDCRACVCVCECVLVLCRCPVILEFSARICYATNPQQRLSKLLLLLPRWPKVAQRIGQHPVAISQSANHKYFITFASTSKGANVARSTLHAARCTECRAYAKLAYKYKQIK